jgi:hypothetical protein
VGSASQPGASTPDKLRERCCTWLPAWRRKVIGNSATIPVCECTAQRVCCATCGHIGVGAKAARRVARVKSAPCRSCCCIDSQGHIPGKSGSTMITPGLVSPLKHLRKVWCESTTAAATASTTATWSRGWGWRWLWRWRWCSTWSQYIGCKLARHIAWRRETTHNQHASGPGCATQAVCAYLGSATHAGGAAPHKLREGPCFWRVSWLAIVILNSLPVPARDKVMGEICESDE